MQKCFDVTVIGAGMFGSAAAKYLSKDQQNIALVGPAESIHKQSASFQLSFGAYYDEARITRRLGWDKVWAETDARSLNRFREIEETSGISFFHEKGSLVLLAQSIAHRTEAIVKQCQFAYIPVQRMTQESMKYRWPYLNIPQLSGGVDGLFEEQMAGYLNPRKLVAAQLTIFERNGGSLIRGNATLVEKNILSGLWEIHVTDNNQVRKLYTKKVLVAAGTFINHNNILPYGYKLDLTTFTEPNLLFELDEESVIRLNTMPATIIVDPADTGNENKSIYLLPPIKYPDGKWYIRIGPGMQPIIKQLETFEEMREWFVQQQITKGQRDFLMHMKQILLPDLTYKSIKEACCIVEKTPSHYPYIGPIDGDTTFQVVTGGNGHGARGSDEIGRLAANVMLGKEWNFPIDQRCFMPVLKPVHTTSNVTMTFKPPFGLC